MKISKTKLLKYFVLIVIVSFVVGVAVVAFSMCRFVVALQRYSDPTEKATESITLPTGEILTNESFLRRGRDDIRYNKLFFQQNASSPREALEEVTEANAPPLSLRDPAPQLYRSGNRTALIIGSHVFQQWHRKDGPYWYYAPQCNMPQAPAELFLRSFLTLRDPQITNSPVSGIRGWMDLHLDGVPYTYDHIDLEQNVLVTRCELSNSVYPKFLVYSAEYGFSFRFDIERTRSANQLKPPPDSNTLIDISVVTYPGERSFDISGRESCLLIRGAKETHAQTLPLSSNTWTNADIPRGVAGNERFEVLLGFWDPLPGYLTIFKRPVWGGCVDWDFLKIGDWVSVDASGLKGGLSREVFIKVRQTQPQ